MSDKILVLITGANQGLGYYAAQQLVATGKYHVLIGSRDISKGETAIKSLVEDKSHKVDATDLDAIQIDVNSDDSILAAAAKVEEKFGYLDIFMSNAGMSQMPTDEQKSSIKLLRASYRTHYETNVFGATMAVEAFLPLLRKSKHPHGKRIAFTSSGLGSLKIAAESEGLYSAKYAHVYRSGKTALNMLMLYYAKTLEEEGFVVSCSDPGYCATNLNNNSGMKDPRDGAKVLVRAATDAKENVHGLVVEEGGILPW